MIKIVLKFILALLFSFIFILPVFSQTVTGCYPNFSPRGTTVAVTITGAGVNFTSVTTVQATLTPSIGPAINSSIVQVTSPTSLTTSFIIPSNATIGDYGINVYAAIQTIAPGMFTVTNAAPGTTGSLSGRVFRDDNSNCLQNGVEPSLTGYIVQILPDSFYAMTNSLGDFRADLVPATYTLSVMPPRHQTQTCPVNSNIATITAPGTSTGNQNFAIELDRVSDGAVTCNLNFLRPGFNQTNYVTVQNLGYYPITGILHFVLDSNLTYLSSSPSGTFSGDTVTWVISNAIFPGYSRNFQIYTHLPSTVPLNTLIHCYSQLILDSTDVAQEDNVSQCIDRVIGSYDPNDKTAWDQDMNPADPYIDLTDTALYYRIRFQNTGTASAITVIVRDTLDSRLDVATLRMVSASHSNYNMNVTGEGDVEWRFPNINLPDSNSNEPGSHGYVMFKIGIKPGFNQGLSINNQAHIYFDFNLPVATNITSTSIFVGIPEPVLEANSRIFPNPAGDKINFSIACKPGVNGRMKMFDSFGKIVNEHSENCFGENWQGEISVRDLTPGVYFLELSVGDKKHVTKVLVMR